MLVLLRSWVNQFLYFICITPSSYRYQFLTNGHHWPLAKNCLTYQRECFYYCFFLRVVLNKVWFCHQGTFHSVWRRFYSCHNCEGGVEYYWHLVGRGEGFHEASYNAQDSSQGITWPKMSIVPLLRSPVLSIFMHLVSLLRRYRIEVHLCTWTRRKSPDHHSETSFCIISACGTSN